MTAPLRVDVSATAFIRIPFPEGPMTGDQFLAAISAAVERGVKARGITDPGLVEVKVYPRMK